MYWGYGYSGSIGIIVCVGIIGSRGAATLHQYEKGIVVGIIGSRGAAGLLPNERYGRVRIRVVRLVWYLRVLW